MLNYKQIWHGIKPIRWLNKFNLTLSPVSILLPSSVYNGDSWKDVCGGGWWFPMAILGWFEFHILSVLFVVWMCLRFSSWTLRFDSICSSSHPFLMVCAVIDYIKGTHLIYALEDMWAVHENLKFNYVRWLATGSQIGQLANELTSTLTTHFLWLFHSFTYIIYTLITHKIVKKSFWKKTLKTPFES